ncbi:MAG: glycoside hydrolase family 31 protein [Bacillota bacterium]
MVLILRKKLLLAAQRLLTTKIPPQQGLALRNNHIEYAGRDHVILKNKYGKIVSGPFNRGIFKVYIRGAHNKAPLLEHDSLTIDLSNKDRYGWKMRETKDTVEFTYALTNGLKARLSVDAAKGTLSFLIGSDLVMAEPLSPQVTRDWLLVKKHVLWPGGVKVFGLGENTPPMNKAGQTIIMWNTFPLVYKQGVTPLYQSWPVVIFQLTDGPAIGLVFDNPNYSVFKFSADGKRMKYSVRDSEISYFVLLGPTMPELMRQLTSLTGALPPMPKWALGYQQSRWSYTPSSRVREIAAEFRKRDIPCDTIYLDIDYMDRYKCFTWGEAFSDYLELIRELHGSGFKLVAILDPGLKTEPGYAPYETGVEKGMFVLDPGGGYVKRNVWAGPSCFPDFVNPLVREWWGGMVEEFVKSGVDGIWCDMNEPSTFDLRRTLPPYAIHKASETRRLPHRQVHNAYGYLMSKATYEGLFRTTRLPYVITRSTYLGGQKYAVTWTGDNGSDWEHFRAGIPMILNLSLSGQPVVGPDIGGYHGTPSPELYERWILQGALYPHSRTHARRNTGDREPWTFGPEVEKSARKAIKLRYRLIPYLYSLLYEAAYNGQPVMRPIFYHAPVSLTLNHQEFYETEFLLGPHLLVAPLMDPAPTRTCCFPPGRWYSWWCRKEHEGGEVYETVAEEDTDLPLFIGENAVIPVYPDPPSYIPDRSLDSLEIIITLKDRAQGTVVEYYDRESLLAYEVRAGTGTGRIEWEIRLKRFGRTPAGYRPPKTLHIRLNHPIRKLRLDSWYSHSLAPDPINEMWTMVTINKPTFPLKGRFIL